MVTSTKISPLGIGDVHFLVTGAIERCPHHMMPRELIVNAIEAARNDVSGKGLIRVIPKSLKQFEGTRKLAIWNNGKGMSDIELSSICNIAASLKTMSLDANFGMGAKVSALGVNHLGMRYRSCKGGIVSQVVIGMEDGIYGKFRMPFRHPNGTITYEDVIDVTEKVRNEAEYPLDSDWTEVVLLGNEPNQDTVSNPYGDGKSPRQWLADALYHRLYRIPDNVAITLEEGTHTRDGCRKFKPFTQRLAQYGLSETVTCDNGIKIHYTHDPVLKDGTSHNASISGAIMSTPSHVALIYKNEMFNVLKSASWGAISPEFGVPFGSRHIIVHIELPDDYPVIPEAYRNFLQMADGDQHQVYCIEFAHLVREHRPEWLVNIIKSFGPKPSVDASLIERELQSLLNSLAVQTVAPRAVAEGNIKVREGAGRGEGPTQNESSNPNPKPGQGSKPTRYVESSEGIRPATTASMRETAPKITLLTEDEQIEERGIVDKVAIFVQGTNDLFINTRYKAITEITEFLETQFVYAREVAGDELSTLAKKIATNIATVKAGRGVVHAKAKAILHTWHEEQIDRACAPEALSIKVDDWADAAEHATREMRKGLGISTSQAKAAKKAA